MPLERAKLQIGHIELERPRRNHDRVHAAHGRVIQRLRRQVEIDNRSAVAAPELFRALVMVRDYLGYPSILEAAASAKTHQSGSEAQRRAVLAVVVFTALQRAE